MMQVSPLSPALGARVIHPDLVRATAREVAMLAACVQRTGLVVVPGQSLDSSALKAFTERLGEVVRVPYVRGGDGDADVLELLKEADEHDVSTFGGEWHSDYSFLEDPPHASLLFAAEVPSAGGDTLWACQAKAWSALPERLRAALRGRSVRHSGACFLPDAPPRAALNEPRHLHWEAPAPGDQLERAVVQPTQHPISGDPVLFANPIYSVGIDGMAPSEAAALLQEVYRYATAPALSYRHRWTVGDLAMWDNRTTLHIAENDYDGHRRRMLRTSVRFR